MWDSKKRKAAIIDSKFWSSPKSLTKALQLSGTLTALKILRVENEDVITRAANDGGDALLEWEVAASLDLIDRSCEFAHDDYLEKVAQKINAEEVNGIAVIYFFSLNCRICFLFSRLLR